MGFIEAAFVALVLLAMLVLLFIGWKTPEVVVSHPLVCRYTMFRLTLTPP